jgi:tetratricopeptide (TPR) repeat protein
LLAALGEGILLARLNQEGGNDKGWPYFTEQRQESGMNPLRCICGVLAIFLTAPSLPVRASANEEEATPEPFLAALDDRYNLEYDDAQSTLEKWLAQHPDDLHGLNELATVILHREMFYRGILASHIYGELGDMLQTGRIPYSPHFQEQLSQVLGKAQGLAESRLKKDPNDQDALYWGGSVHATRAVFYFTMAKSYLAALRESTEARKYHAQLLKLNPNFIDAWLVVGINDYVLGSLPWYFKVFASLAGYHGDRKRGIEEVRRVTQQGHWAREDAKVILAVLTRREKLYPETLQILQSLAKTYPRNFLLQREIAGLYELQGDLRSASTIYDSLVSKRESKQPGYTQMPAARILYEAGQIHDRLGETGTALARYEEAGKLPGDDIYVYRSDLAAAGLYLRMNHRPQALRKYQRVASRIPDTEEGKIATRALKKFYDSGQIKASGAE